MRVRLPLSRRIPVRQPAGQELGQEQAALHQRDALHGLLRRAEIAGDRADGSHAGLVGRHEARHRGPGRRAPLERDVEIASQANQLAGQLPPRRSFDERRPPWWPSPAPSAGRPCRGCFAPCAPPCRRSRSSDTSPRCPRSPGAAGAGGGHYAFVGELRRRARWRRPENAAVARGRAPAPGRSNGRGRPSAESRGRAPAPRRRGPDPAPPRAGAGR